MTMACEGKPCSSLVLQQGSSIGNKAYTSEYHIGFSVSSRDGHFFYKAVGQHENTPLL